MSAEAMGWVWKNSPYKGSALLVHLAVADSVNDLHGNTFWMSMAKLGKKCRITRQTAQESMTRLERDGYLERVDENERFITVKYVFKFPVVTGDTGVGNPDRVTKPDKMSGNGYVSEIPTPPVVTADTPDGNADRPVGSADTTTQGNPRRTQVEPKARSVKKLDPSLMQSANDLCALLSEEMVKNGCKTPTISVKWTGAMEKVLRIDKRPVWEVAQVIRFAHGGWWAKVILSPESLRRNYDKVRLAMQEADSKRFGGTADRLVREALEMRQREEEDEGERREGDAWPVVGVLPAPATHGDDH